MIVGNAVEALNCCVDTKYDKYPCVNTVHNLPVSLALKVPPCVV
jgi:hypothetical protein